MIFLNDYYQKILKNIKFIDLFSGIGGFRLSLESYGAKCVFSCDNNKFACETYKTNFGDNSYCDITKIDEKIIPDHDILCAGFPCQAFSISGKQKGFEDIRGTLFFDLVRIIKYKKPSILFLENVNNLLIHDNGNTFKKMEKTLSELNYTIFFKVLNSSEFGLAQSRKRIYILGFEKNKFKNINFDFPKSFDSNIIVNNILVKSDDLGKYYISKKDINIKSICTQNNLILSNKPIKIGKMGKGGQGERIYSVFGKAITLSAEGGGPGSKTGAYLVNDFVRKLTPRECARLQGFPDDFKITVSDNQAWKQFGNTVSINVLQSILKEIIDNKTIIENLKEK